MEIPHPVPGPLEAPPAATRVKAQQMPTVTTASKNQLTYTYKWSIAHGKYFLFFFFVFPFLAPSYFYHMTFK